MLIIPTPSSLSFKQHTLRSSWFGLLSHMNFLIKSFTSFLYFSGTTSFHHVTCQIIISDLMMHVHTCFTDNTTYPTVYFRSICQTYWWMHTHVLLITPLTQWCMSDHYVRYKDVHTHICYWKHYLNVGVCHITMSVLMMNVHTCLRRVCRYRRSN